MVKKVADYVITEYEWLVDNGVHPLLAARQLDRNPFTLSRMLRRYGREDLARPLDHEARWGKG